jgi:uncharacterized membrane protein YczE
MMTLLENPYFVYGFMVVFGAVLHWAQKAKKGEATWNVWDYWVAETPGYSVGTAGAIVAAIWLVVETSALAGVGLMMVISSAFAIGWAIDSAVAPGNGKPK